MTLDLCRMVGDLSFVILSIPAEFLHACYKRSMFYVAPTLDSVSENSQGTKTPPTKSDLPVLKRAAQESERGQQPLSFPKKTSSDRPASESERRPSRSRARVDQVGQRVQANGQPNKHQIWYPPPSAYSDEEDIRETGATDSQTLADDSDAEVILNEAQKALDEWRQYPAFPSAYPPTPLVSSSSVLPGTSAAAARIQPLSSTFALSEILEDASQQDFSKSLLPPRKPLDPGFVDDLSDDFQSPGVPSSRLDHMSVDSDSEDDEEDIFNTTLQTPTAPLRATRSGIIPALPINREISLASSVASRSTALTTNATDSPSHTNSSSESLSSDALSMPDFTSVLGKKRPLSLDASDANTKSELMPGTNKHRRALGASSSTLRVPVAGTFQTPIDVADEDTESTFSTAESVDDRKPTLPKRRKVSRTPKRTTNAAQPIRPRIAKHATVPTKAPLPKPPKPSASSSRDALGPSTRLPRRTGNTVSSDATASSSLSSLDGASSQGTKLNAKGVVKGKSRLNPPSKAT
ncbi:hypothetical protein H0H87_011085 [Tephrocybe sp. NHM501043]|nr:hypothetical protein H0H87_011085 [Tephrocybe sp. NHM501043]